MNWKEHFIYDENSPSGLSCTKTGKHAGGYYKTGNRNLWYWKVWIGRKTYSAARLIYEIKVGEIPKDYVIDHINRDTSDNRLYNLRSVPRVLNCRNNSKRPLNISGFTGVYFDSYAGQGRWCARWVEDGKARKKNFAVSKYGNAHALELAVQYRKEQIERLNTLGYGYTETHGL